MVAATTGIIWSSLLVLIGIVLIILLPLYGAGKLGSSTPSHKMKKPKRNESKVFDRNNYEFSPHLQVKSFKADYLSDQMSSIAKYNAVAQDRITPVSFNPANVSSNIIYINMAKDTERNDQMLELLELYKDEFNIYRFDGMPVPNNGAKGCFLSHLHVLAWAAYNLPDQRVLILEDDFVFNVDFDTMKGKVSLTDRELSCRWDVLVFGQYVTDWQPIETPSGQLFRLFNSTTTSGYLVNGGYVKMLFTKWKQSMDLIEWKDNFGHRDNLDQIQTLFQKSDVWIGFKCPLGTQRYGLSTIGNNFIENAWSCSEDLKHWYAADKTKQYDLHTRPVLKIRRVGVCFVATGKYQQFLKPVIDSCISNFAKPHSLQFFVFTDSQSVFPDGEYQGFPVSKYYVDRKGFPGDTLYRYHYMLKAESELRSSTDHMFYMDVDYWVCNRDDTSLIIGDEPGLVAVPHIHNLQRHSRSGKLKGTPETNVKSTACIHKHEKMQFYFCGGFQGGTTPEYLQACKSIADNIDQDDKNNITAIWHDESHWNRYLVNQPPRTILSQSYVFPEECLSLTDNGNGELLKTNNIVAVMVALSKNHKEFQVSA